jgi:hypothetical protein
MRTPRYTPNAYYVLDELTGDASRRIVSGPFKTSWAAELDRRELNIAGDCCGDARGIVLVSTATDAPIMLRARITSAEYRELRVIGARTDTPVAELVAAALRGCYPLSPDAEPSVRPATTEGNPPV